MLDKVLFDINDQVIALEDNAPKFYVVDSIAIDSGRIVYQLKELLTPSGSVAKYGIRRSQEFVYKDLEELVDKMRNHLGIKPKTKTEDGKASEKSSSETESTDS